MLYDKSVRLQLDVSLVYLALYAADVSMPELNIISSLILTGLVGMSSFAGAWLSSYLKKKGENLATKEDFESLLHQTKRTTEETENIKQELASLGWLTQRQWQMKERYYTEILEQLFKFKITLEERADYFLQPGSEHDESCTQTEHYRNQNHLGAEAYEAVLRISGSAAVVISEKSIEAIYELRAAQWESTNHSVCEADFLKNSQAAVNKTYGVVLAEAKTELANVRT